MDCEEESIWEYCAGAKRIDKICMWHRVEEERIEKENPSNDFYGKDEFCFVDETTFCQEGNCLVCEIFERCIGVLDGEYEN